ncbi:MULTISPECIES: hypothetical protein [Paenibacillus]|nr:hypothetical protein [Paenibacillus caseinilyticus]MCZ8520918.1 hypothetical protein [Paenibacillus caseinilyticus]
MDDKSMYIVTVDDQDHCFDTYAEFCNFMSDNSQAVIKCIEKRED